MYYKMLLFFEGNVYQNINYANKEIENKRNRRHLQEIKFT